MTTRSSRRPRLRERQLVARRAPSPEPTPASSPVSVPLYSGALYGRFTAAVIGVAGLLYALVARFALKAFPFSGDEYSYLLQAEGFARGSLKAPAPPFADWVNVDHVVIDQFVRSKYPPGTSALLSLGVLGHVPWLVTPLEGVLTLVVMWFAVRAVLGERRAFFAVAFLGCAPLFGYQAATFYSQIPTLLFASLAVLAVALWSKKRQARYFALFGAVCGVLFLIRPLDAVLVGLALFALRDLRGVALAAVSALPFVAAGLYYNELQFGSIFTDGYQAYAQALAAVYGAEGAVNQLNLNNLVSPQQLWNHLEILETFLMQWTVPGSGLVACIGFLILRRDQQRGHERVEPFRNFLATLIVVFVGALLITMADPDDGARPRYLTVVLLPLAAFAAAGWGRVKNLINEQLGKKMGLVASVTLWIAPIFLIGAYLEKRVPEVVVHAGLEEMLRNEHVDSGVVIVRAEWPTRYAHNGMFFDRGPLLLSVSNETGAGEVAARFPGQPIYEAFEPEGNNPWKHPWTIKRVR